MSSKFGKDFVREHQHRTTLFWLEIHPSFEPPRRGTGLEEHRQEGKDVRKRKMNCKEGNGSVKNGYEIAVDDPLHFLLLDPVLPEVEGGRNTILLPVTEDNHLWKAQEQKSVFKSQVQRSESLGQMLEQYKPSEGSE